MIDSVTRRVLFVFMFGVGLLLVGPTSEAEAAPLCTHGWYMLKDSRTKHWRCCPRGSAYSTIGGRMTCTSAAPQFTGRCGTYRVPIFFGRQRYCCPQGMRVTRFGRGYRCDVAPAAPLNCANGHWVRGVGRSARCVKGCAPGLKTHWLPGRQRFCCAQGTALVRQSNGSYICYKRVRNHPRGGVYSCSPGYVASQASNKKYFCCLRGSRAVVQYGRVQCVHGAAPSTPRCGAGMALYRSADRRRHACCLPSAKRIAVGRSGVRCGPSPRCRAGQTLYRRPNGSWSCCGAGLVAQGYACRGPGRRKSCSRGQRAFYAPGGSGFCCQSYMYGVAIGRSRVLCYR